MAIAVSLCYKRLGLLINPTFRNSMYLSRRSRRPARLDNAMAFRRRGIDEHRFRPTKLETVFETDRQDVGASFVGDDAPGLGSVVEPDNRTPILNAWQPKLYFNHPINQPAFTIALPGNLLARYFCRVRGTDPIGDACIDIFVPGKLLPPEHDWRVEFPVVLSTKMSNRLTLNLYGQVIEEPSYLFRSRERDQPRISKYDGFTGKGVEPIVVGHLTAVSGDRIIFWFICIRWFSQAWKTGNGNHEDDQKDAKTSHYVYTK